MSTALIVFRGAGDVVPVHSVSACSNGGGPFLAGPTRAGRIAVPWLEPLQEGRFAARGNILWPSEYGTTFPESKKRPARVALRGPRRAGGDAATARRGGAHCGRGAESAREDRPARRACSADTTPWAMRLSELRFSVTPGAFCSKCILVEPVNVGLRPGRRGFA